MQNAIESVALYQNQNRSLSENDGINRPQPVFHLIDGATYFSPKLRFPAFCWEIIKNLG